MKTLLSFAIVAAVAFATHLFYISKIEPTDREIANFGERNSPQQMKWEQKVTDDLVAQANVNAGVKPTWQDQLVYEVLMGQYDVSVEKGGIRRISLQKSMNGVELSTDRFVEKFGRQMKEFSTFKINRIDGLTDDVQLIDQAGASAGSFLFKRNTDGKLIEFNVR